MGGTYVDAKMSSLSVKSKLSLLGRKEMLGLKSENYTFADTFTKAFKSAEPERLQYTFDAIDPGVAIAQTVVELLCFVLLLLVLIWFANVNKFLLTASHFYLISLILNEVMYYCFTASVISIIFQLSNLSVQKLMCMTSPVAAFILTECGLWHFAFFAIHRTTVVIKKSASDRDTRLALVTYCLVLCRILPFSVFFVSDFDFVAVFEPKMIRCFAKFEHPFDTAGIACHLCIPAIIVTGCYVFCAAVLKKKIKTRNFESPLDEAWMRKQTYVMRIFGLMFIAYFAGLVPYLIVLLLNKDLTFFWGPLPIVSIILSFLIEVSRVMVPLVACVKDREINRAITEKYLPCLKKKKTDQRPSFYSRPSQISREITISKDTEVIWVNPTVQEKKPLPPKPPPAPESSSDKSSGESEATTALFLGDSDKESEIN